ncbi:MAG: thiol reductant ABC exporter subunit CydC [Micrococcales bacterium]|nr:thiol reductant ABC exporter subunit CydC [Micrococcales bacterium]
MTTTQQPTTQVRWALIKAIKLTGLKLRQLAAAVFFGALTQGASVGLAATSAWLIVRASQMPPVLALQVAVVLVRAFGITRGVSRYVERLTAHRVALNGMTELRVRLYERMACASPAATASLRRGDILARVGADVEDVGDLVVRGIIPTLVAGVLMVASSLTLGYFLPLAGLALFICLTLVAVGGPLLTLQAAKRSQRRASKARADVAATSLDIMENAAELRVSGQMGSAWRALASREREAFKAQEAIAKPAAWAALLTEAATGLALLTCLVVGAWAFNQGQISATELGILTLTPMAAFEAVAGLPAAAAQVFRSRVAASRIIALAEAGHEPGAQLRRHSLPDAGPASPATKGTLVARNLSCAWPDQIPVLDGVNLTMAPGEMTGIVGQSGVGKTTLLATLSGLLPPAAGSVKVGDRDLASLETASRAQTVAYIAEDAHIFATTVLENLRVVRGDITPDQARAALDSVGLGQWLEALPNSLDTMLGGDGTTISGGERRRLLLARVLLSPARFILLDEPAEHLDPKSADQLTAELVGMASQTGRGLLVVSHRVSPLALATNVLVLDQGKIVASGSHKELLANSEPYRLALRAEELDN